VVTRAPFRPRQLEPEIDDRRPLEHGALLEDDDLLGGGERRKRDS